MPRFLAILLCAIAMLSLSVSPVAHAAERGACVEAPSGDRSFDIDRDQSGPDGADKNFAHQHTGCHAHHLAALTTDTETPSLVEIGEALLSWRSAALVAATSDPALRPPQA